MITLRAPVPVLPPGPTHLRTQEPLLDAGTSSYDEPAEGGTGRGTP